MALDRLVEPSIGIDHIRIPASEVVDGGARPVVVHVGVRGVVDLDEVAPAGFRGAQLDPAGA